MHARLRGEIAKAVVGQGEAVDELLAAFLAGGHVLLEGVPGVAKTLIAKSLARALDLDFRRVQFTPDLMPADVLGTNVYRAQSGSFELVRGPIFTEVLLADEVNRTPPKTQAALLEAMEERQVTIDGTRHALGEAFFVVATQNPIEYEGTYPLPEAQTDRFLMKVRVGYPAAEEEAELLRRAARGFDAHDLEAAGVTAVLGREELKALRARARALPAAEPVLEYVARLARGSRELSRARLGASPRAAVSLLAAARARAALRGAEWLSPDDVKAVARPVLRHRLVLRPEAELEGATPDDLVEEILETVEVPR
ncbi:MAG TPA: MoxR family ATPase [Anaeromyxobacteraceae bacterium]|jgi:MoxR-like ATPase|nr:MoxR family ATPase [Anaeromyxobacteraceae bacterium]